MLAFLNYPDWLKPEVFGFLNLPPGHFLNVIRWYGLMYIVAISIAYFLSMYLLKTEKFETLNRKVVDDYYFWAVIGLIFGARIFSCIIYDFPYYSVHPLEILFPFREGHFVGFQGMSFHGGAFGIFLASLIYIKVKKVNFRELCDVIFPSIPLGYTFGRLGNFINGELYGRITSSPIGMFFPDAQKLPIKFPEVSKVINDIGWKINELNQTVVDGAGNIINNVLGKMTISGEEVTTINLPRHPSQLYEAFFEGIVLFFIVWFLGRKYKPFKGFTASVYLVGYALARIFVEFFRQPDSQFANIEQGKLTGFIVSFFSMGQILSFLMILFAIGLGFYFYKLSLDDKLKPKIETKTKNKKNK